MLYWQSSRSTIATVDATATFDDAQLAQFERFAPYLVEANLARTVLTDQSLDTLAKFIHLRALHLSETKVTAAAIAPLSNMKNLRHVYLYNTPAQPVVPTLQTVRTTP